MLRIKSVDIQEEKIPSLHLDFCDANGNPVDTVILAGENGTGKSTVLNDLYFSISHQSIYNGHLNCQMIITDGNVDYSVEYNVEHNSARIRINGMHNQELVTVLKAIFSDVEINFITQDLQSVTSLELDKSATSRKSSSNLPTETKQLLIDIQALDDSELSKAYRNAVENGLDANKIEYTARMPRFTNAFNQMFDGLEYKGVENAGNAKVVVFEKNGVRIPLDSLSSGEKQIVFRGCFLLRDANALNGAFVFIDEPEISLHPVWQQKVLEYYKNIFTDSTGNQTSQLFVVTHSPFIIHNPFRKNDKVIILERNENGEIVVSDKKEYYKCDSIEAVEDAFHIDTFSSTSYQTSPTVYLEGRTDEKYFRKACEVFGYKNLPFAFKWVGYMSGDNEVNTGKDSVEKAYHFLIAQDLDYKNICLFDSDVNKNFTNAGNVYVRCLKKHERQKMKIGIENALRLDDVDVSDCYDERETIGDYGEKKTVQTLNKMKCCEKICSMDNENLKEIFADLKDEIDTLIKIYSGEHNET